MWALLILDDWGMEMLDAAERSNLLEIIDTRCRSGLDSGCEPTAGRNGMG